MTFQPKQDYLWDFWFAPRVPGDDGLFHLFYLSAPRSIPHPEDRHFCARIGHAVSHNLIDWTEKPVVFEPDRTGCWDDLAIWTGSILHHDGRYWFFYTAIDQRTRGRIQRIGLATSTDLEHWTRHPENPILTADPRWYMTYDTDPARDEPLRDPVVTWDEQSQRWLMVYCAKANHGPLDGRGVIGAAESTDLLTWRAIPPLEMAPEFGELEVPAPVRIGNRWYLVFCTQHHSQVRLARTGPSGKWYGTHYLVADDLGGPYRLLHDEPLLGDQDGSWYAGRIETGLTGSPLFFAWQRLDDSGAFVGALSNPVPVTVATDGSLSIDPTLLESLPGEVVRLG